jgi:hypothetical protein
LLPDAAAKAPFDPSLGAGHPTRGSPRGCAPCPWIETDIEISFLVGVSFARKYCVNKIKSNPVRAARPPWRGYPRARRTTASDSYSGLRQMRYGSHYYL